MATTKTESVTPHAPKEEARNRLTREALADVDAARVIDHQAVQTWANSLSAEAPLPVPH